MAIRGQLGGIALPSLAQQDMMASVPQHHTGAALDPYTGCAEFIEFQQQPWAVTGPPSVHVQHDVCAALDISYSIGSPAGYDYNLVQDPLA